jgi:YVTN family beta-propeller protein
MKKIVWLLFVVIIAVSCTEKSTTDPVTLPFRENGIFIVNQGNYTYANASLSYYNPDEKTVQQNVFYETNGVPLGDVAQSIAIQGDTAYVVVNNSGFIYAINRHNGEFIGKLTGFESPRQILFVNPQKAYVSDLYANYITVVSPLTTEVIKQIYLGRSTEAMMMVDDRVFVAHWSDYNQMLNNNLLSVIDSETDQIIDSVIVGKEPNSMVVDNNGKLWVLCSGGYMNDELPSLWQIDPSTLQVTKEMRFANINSNPTCLSINRKDNQLLYLNGGIYQVNPEQPMIPSNIFIEQGEHNFYALYVFPENGELYASDAGNYLSNGYVYRYNADGNEIDHFEAGIMPGAFLINK